MPAFSADYIIIRRKIPVNAFLEFFNLDRPVLLFSQDISLMLLKSQLAISFFVPKEAQLCAKFSVCSAGVWRIMT